MFPVKTYCRQLGMFPAGKSSVFFQCSCGFVCNRDDDQLDCEYLVGARQNSEGRLSCGNVGRYFETPFPTRRPASGARSSKARLSIGSTAIGSDFTVQRLQLTESGAFPPSDQIELAR
jgi:hypothetical protein